MMYTLLFFIQAEPSSEDLVTEQSKENETAPQEDDINTLLSKMKPDELKKLIREVADSKFNSVKVCIFLCVWPIEKK